MCLLVTVLIAAAALAVAGCGDSDPDSDSGDSQQRTLISGPISAAAVDEGKKGSSAGDTRAFSQELFEEGSDDPAGRLDGTTTITDVVKQGGKALEYRSGTIQFTLDGGNIIASGIYVAEPDVAVPAEGVDRAITGGTGDYVGARGQVRITAEDDEHVRYELDFSTGDD